MTDSVQVTLDADWAAVPGSPVEVRHYMHEPIGTLHFRWNNEVADLWLQDLLYKNRYWLRSLIDGGWE